MGILSTIRAGRAKKLAEKVVNEKWQEAVALYKMGEAYYRGDGVEQDFSKAFDYFTRADEMGVPEASCLLGDMYEYGLWVECNKEKAFSAYQRSANLGYMHAYACLGYTYETGRLAPQDYRKAVEMYEIAANGGSLIAQKRLARMYIDGIGIQANAPRAFELFLKAAEQGDSEAQAMVAWCYEKGKGTQRHYGEAKWWAQKSVDQGSALGMYIMSMVAENTQQSEKWLLKAADAGDINALCEVAKKLESFIDYFGEGGYNYAKAQQYWKKASELGNEEAEWALKYPDDPWRRETMWREDRMRKAGINPCAGLGRKITETVTTDIHGNTIAYSTSDGNGTTVHVDAAGNTLGYSYDH